MRKKTCINCRNYKEGVCAKDNLGTWSHECCGDYEYFLTDRERFMLKEALHHHIYRYLLSNTAGRHDPVERAERHSEIAGILVAFIRCGKYHDTKHFEIRKEIHDYLAEILTDRMDEVIGFPLNTVPIDYEELVNKFFAVIEDHLRDIERIVKSIEVELDKED